MVPSPSLRREDARVALVWEISVVFLRLGCTSFGGPVAHLGYFQNEFVQRRRWVSATVYADVVALCQFLPGPASSQVCFVLGYLRSGLLGGLLGWMAFTAPSTFLMIGFAYGVHLLDVTKAGWLLGLKAAAAAVVAQAVWIMGKKLCPDFPRLALMLTSAGLLIVFRSAWLQPVVIAAGGFVGLIFLGMESPSAERQENFTTNLRLSRPMALTSLISFVGLLIISLSSLHLHGLPDLFVRFYRTGSLVFGGGHVVLPLLQVETVRSGLVSHDAFLAGYGAAQALPGPLFTFAAFLGASIPSAWPGWFQALWCLGAILLPSLLLIVGVLPYWSKLTGSAQAQAVLKGANAAVVGLLLAAFYDPVLKSGVTSLPAALIALAAFAALQLGKVPNWAVVIGCAVSGELLL